LARCSSDDPANVRLSDPSTHEELQRLTDMLLALKPANPLDQWRLDQAMTFVAKIGDTRSLLAQEVGKGTHRSSWFSSVRKFGLFGALVREQLKHGPKPELTVMAGAHLADIPERSLIAAADALGVRTRKGQWGIPENVA
jgi:hypothetical protein